MKMPVLHSYVDRNHFRKRGGFDNHDISLPEFYLDRSKMTGDCCVFDFFRRTVNVRGRRGGLMVSELDSGSSGAGSSPGRDIVLCSWARHLTLTAPLHPGV